MKRSSWGLRIEVRDVVRERERLRKAGIEVKEVKTVPGTISFFGIRDPDNNDLLFFQVLTSDPKVTGRRAQKVQKRGPRPFPQSHDLRVGPATVCTVLRQRGRGDWNRMPPG